MAITQVAAYTPTDRRPQVFALSNPATVEINNPTTYRLVAFLGRGLRDIIQPGDHKLYTRLNNLAVAPSWLMLSALDVPDSAIASPLLGTVNVTSYGVADPLPATGAYSNGSFTVPSLTQTDGTEAIRAISSFNVRDFGAVGDGVTDDGPAIRAALDAARLVGGARVVVPAGTYAVGMTMGASNGTTIAALVIGSGTVLQGEGAGNSVLMLLPNQPNQGYLIHNYSIAGGDVDMGLADITVHGNAANQVGAIDAQYGSRFFKAQRVGTHRVVWKDVFGTTDGSVLGPNGTAGEGFAHRYDSCADVVDMYGFAVATSANTSTGFASDSATNISRIGCTSTGWAHGMGFTDWTAQNVQYSGCHAYLNGKHGFNIEHSANAVYSGCQSGGKATATGAYPFTNGQSLGNTGSGFTNLGSDNIFYIACDSEWNTSHGLQVYDASFGHVTVVGGTWANNGGSGISMDANQVRSVMIIGQPRIFGNTVNAVATGSVSAPTAMTVLTGVQTPPAVPATTVALTNPFPIPMLVNITGGTVSAIALNGTTVTGFTAGMLRMEVGDTVTLTYTAAPAWQWFSAM